MFVVYDTESSDMLNFKLDADHPDQARIVQIAVALVSAEFEIIETAARIIKPDGWVIAPGAEKAHGISLERCHDEGVAIAEAIEEFDAYCDRGEVLAAFNIRWDNKFVRGERRRLGREDRFGVMREFDVMHAAKPICNIPATARMKRYGKGGGVKTPNLGEAVRILCGYELEGAHDALVDVKGTVDVMRVLHKEHGVDVTGEFPKSYAEKPQPAAPAAPVAARKPEKPGDPESLDIF